MIIYISHTATDRSYNLSPDCQGSSDMGLLSSKQRATLEIYQGLKVNEVYDDGTTPANHIAGSGAFNAESGTVEIVRRGETSGRGKQLRKTLKIAGLVVGGVLLIVCFLLHTKGGEDDSDQAKPVSSMQHMIVNWTELEKEAADERELIKNLTLIQHSLLMTMRVGNQYPGWYMAANSRVYKLFMSRVTYDEAKRSCEGRNARLAAVGLRDEIQRRKLIENVISPGDYDTYIGLHDDAVNNTWVWSDGVISDGTDTDWAENEPNDPIGEPCVEMRRSQGWKLNDIPCTEQHFYICESIETFEML